MSSPVHLGHRSRITLALAVAIASVTFGASAVGVSRAAGSDLSTDIVGPAGSNSFGAEALVLKNGNFVVTDPGFSSAAGEAIGAVYLFDGATNTIISTLHGARAGDRIGSGNVLEVGSSNFVVLSPQWSSDLVSKAGALTFVDGTTGRNGVVSPANSLFGSHTNDLLESSVAVLANGSYVLTTPFWDNPPFTDVGAATWQPATVGAAAPISTANSLTGFASADGTGMYTTALTNGHFVVVQPAFGILADVGAATWGDGFTGAGNGVVSGRQSLIGQFAGDFTQSSVTPLSNGNYVVATPMADRSNVVANSGAATWRAGNPGGAQLEPGTISALTSLVGSSQNDNVGQVTALTNGNYVVNTQQWARAALDVGATTWGDGARGTAGPVSSDNSLVGSHGNDGVFSEVVPLSNGNYVVDSHSWARTAGAPAAGAVTFQLGDAAHAPETIGPAVSLVGRLREDGVGGFVVPLANGNYVVASSRWDNGAIEDVGAVTWGSGILGVTGDVTAANSIVGRTLADEVGENVIALPSGDFVVGSSGVSVGGLSHVGATTRLPGDRATTAPIDATNSLIGTIDGDKVGSSVTLLPNGDAVVGSPLWSEGDQLAEGAVTFVRAGSTPVGQITRSNSLVGNARLANAGLLGITPFTDGSFLVLSKSASLRTGSVTRVPAGGSVGPITADNSIVVSVPNAIDAFSVVTDDTGLGHLTAAGAMLLNRPSQNIVTLLNAPANETPPTTTPPTTTPPTTTPPTTTPPTGNGGGGGPAGAGDFLPLEPARLADTRNGSTTADGQLAGGGPRDLGSVLEVPVAGRGGVPMDAVGVALNVTAVGPLRDGFLTVFACGEPQPTASNVNILAGHTTPNAVLTKIGSAGAICVFNSQPTQIVVDVTGAFPRTSTYTPLLPARLLDTRNDGTTIDGTEQGTGVVRSGSTLRLHVTGRGGAPAAVNSVALNVTATQAAAAGFVTVFPCDTSRPNASNLNIEPGVDVAGLVLSRTDATGDVCLFTSQDVHLVADVNGFFPPSSPYLPLVPGRLLDTRAGFTTIDGIGAGGGQVPVGTITRVHVLGRANVGASSTSVVINITVTDPVADGFVTVFPCGITPPLASNLNFDAGQTIPNAAISKIGTNGDVCLFNSQAVQLIADVSGAFIS